MHSFFMKKKCPNIFKERRLYALSSYLFPFLKVSSITFVVQTMAFQAKLPSHCVFKVMQYGYEIFQTVLSLSYKIIQLKTFNLVTNFSLISNKTPRLFSAICSEINTASSKHNSTVKCKGSYKFRFSLKTVAIN